MNYGYGEQQQQTTSYGAQGGADGGGFMNQYGSQAGSQGTPSKTYGKDTLRPVTIRQLLLAQQPHPDAEFKIDGTEVTQITFVGQIRNISTQTTNVTYKIDDGTAIIEVKVWNDADAATGLDDADRSAAVRLVEGAYVRVWGRMKAYNNKRVVGAHVVRRVEDLNEVQYHLLEATVVHLYFTRGPPDQGTKIEAGAMQANAPYAQAQAGAGDGGNMHSNMGRALPQLSASARRVYDVLHTCPQNNEGLHVQNIAAQSGLPISEVYKAGDELQNKSLIFSTVDDDTWATLET
ncbi:MAG: replication factor A protein 2 [Phylliscum demangeonii]|nr:MAG: replication factor A protein 2 [Phylliscum demangeonii]